MMRNRPDFHWFDAAAQFLRATAVSIYNSSSPEEIAYLAGHAGAKVAILEDDGFLERFLKVRAELPLIEHIFVHRSARRCCPKACTRPASCSTAARPTSPRWPRRPSPSDLATLIYTSGTTGPPKGVMLDQHNVVYTSEQLRRCLDLDELRRPAPHLLPADGPHRRADDEPLPAHAPRLHGHLLPRPVRRSPSTPARCTPR